MTTTYSVTRDQIISGALRKLQVLELGTTPDVDTLTNASASLNLLIKAWQTQGIKLWTVKEIALPLVTSQNLYRLGHSPIVPTVVMDVTTDKPLKVIQAWLRNIVVAPNTDTPVQILSRQEYNMLGSKSATGQVNSIWFDPRTTYGEVHTYLTPDTFTATNFQLYLVAQIPLGDVTVGTDIPDFPNEWIQALTWGLADELALEYGCHINQRQEIMVKAEKYRNDLTDWDVENSSTFFQVDTRK
jgi:hypothetical protein